MLPRRLLSVLILALAALAATAGLSGASEPPESAAVDLPAGATSEPIVREWTGTIPQATTGAGTSTCTGRDDAEIDRHSVKINVPAGLYDRFTSQAKFTVQFDPGPLEQNDAVLTVINQDIEPAGSSGGTEGSESGEVGSSDNSDTAPEQVVGTNLAGATYEAQVCAYKNTGPVSYTARLEVTTAPVTPALPAAGAQGLAFSASVPADPQRDEGEPLIEIDGDGTIYTCGPTGASQAAEYAQVSTDDGQQFHLLGEPPRGQIAPGGGGDCSLATGFDRNAQGVFNLAYSGLGPLTNFATSKSADNGRSFQGSPISGQTVPGVDRQWQTFLDADTVLLSYNQQQPRQIVVQKSDDGGLTYGLRVPATATDPSFPGPMRSMENPAPGDQPRIAYFSWNAGTDVNLAVSFDGAETWKNCRLAKSAGEPTLFTTSDNDRDGNIYVAYGENATFHTYMTALPVANLNNCDQGTDKFPDKDPGVLAPVQVDRAGVSSSLFAWLTAGGEPGRVAVGFYGTATDGDPNLGTFKASWNVYVNQSVNALAPDATFSQVQATTHPIHYDSICLNGLGCDVGGGDRSLSDFFAIDYSPRSGKIHVVYDTAYKVPGEAQGVIATPTVFSQIGGPSLGGGAVDRAKSPEPLRDVSDDPADDAISDYSTLDSPNAPTKQPAADFRNVALAPPDGKGGVTVTMKLADLSDAALQQALQSGSNGTTPATRLIWIFRWFNGYRSAAAVAKYDPAQGFSTGFNGFETGSAQCGGSGSKCLQYTGSQPIEGKVDQKAGTITMTVPKDKLRALRGSQGPGERPAEVPAEIGDRLYDGTAFSLLDTSVAGSADQSFLYPLDNTPAMDFLVGGSPQSGDGGGGLTPPPGGTNPPGGGVEVPGCAEGAGFRRVAAKRRQGGRKLRLVFSRRGKSKVEVDVFQQSRGRRVVGERLVARFRGRRRSFVWNGRATSGRKRVRDGYYFVRFRTRSPEGRRDTRRIVLRRSNGRFAARKGFYRRATCDLVPSFKLSRPVFGGSGRPANLGISFRVAARARVTVTVRRAGKVVQRFKRTSVAPKRTIRLRLKSKGLGRGDYRVRLVATAPGAKTVRSTLVSRRL